MELWRSAKASNVVRIQRFQSKVLRSILDAPWYVSNHTIHTDLNTPFYISDLIKTRFQQFHSRLSIHPNLLAQAPSSPHHPLHPPGRLNRQWPRDLLWVPIDYRKCHWWVASSLSPRCHYILFTYIVLITFLVILVDYTNKNLLKIYIKEI
jgi:hypothetical protein